MALQIEKITDTPSFCFLWSGSGVSLQWGRACLRKWGYRRCEDISWIKSNRETGKNINFLPDSVVTPTTEHCLVGIKVRRSLATPDASFCCCGLLIQLHTKSLGDASWGASHAKVCASGSIRSGRNTLGR